MGRRIPRDSETGPEDAVKVTGRAIRCTKYSETASAPFIDHIRGRGGKSARRRRRRRRDCENGEETVMTRARRILLRLRRGCGTDGEATTERPLQFPSPFHAIQIVFHGSRRFFTDSWLPFNFSSTNTREQSFASDDFFRFQNQLIR